MIPCSLGELAAVTGGRLSVADVTDVIVTGAVVTDSREAEPGSLYVARIGEHADGHIYTGAAAERGAVAALVTAPVSEVPYVIVDDVQEAFAAIATHLIDTGARSGLTVVGVTGSSGKTTTKDLIAHVLSSLAPTVANVGSLNSEVGVPLTVCRLVPETRYLVLEMGARGIGHVRYLTDMTHPSVGVVLNVGSAHLGEFGTQQAIARAKAELVEALPPGGLAVLNADDPLVAAMPVSEGVDVLRYGRSDEADVRATNVQVNDSGCATFDLNFRCETVTVDLRLMGDYQVSNALAAACVALWRGMSLADVGASLSAATPASRYRMERHERSDGVTIVNDAYNANPESMRGAVQTLSRMGASGRRTWAALGQMLELGPDSASEHRAIGALARDLGITSVVAVGDSADVEALAQGASERLHQGEGPAVYRAASVDEAEGLLARNLQEGDLVLVKSSHGAGLRVLGERLVEGASHP
ncbi:MAG: UDP-N-acetylmuramoyl-tripeptide--D-alanyl-D-alanine ligase [Dermatophilus congolensis]|nr:UDP-N-acetylmuramoyl-tripeptide--D-alanyl-D-alanine ligase [Dermatophilus congolensis]